MIVGERILLNAAVVAAAFAVAVSSAALAQSGPPPEPNAKKALSASHPILNASLDRLSAGSALWRAATDTLAELKRRALVVTPNFVRMRDLQRGTETPFDADVLAEVQPIADSQSRVDTVVVVVNLPLLERLHAPRGATVDFEDDLDRILAHEIYGHAIPYLLAGHLSGKCSDPLPGQRASDSCAVKRENEIRAELWLGRRDDYGVDGLAIARRYRY